MAVRIAVCTGGGDAPGLNAAVAAVVRSARRIGWRVVGIRDGLDGVLHPGRFPDGGMVELTEQDVAAVASRGGSLLGTSSAGAPSDDEIGSLASRFADAGVEALVAVGGDGTQTIAAAAHARGVRVVGVPKTIDNDLFGTEVTFGFDSACRTIADALGSLRESADAHGRVFVVEVMGRDAGWLALYGGLAGGADAVLIPEVGVDADDLVSFLDDRRRSGWRSSLVVVAEGVQVGSDRPLADTAPGPAEPLVELLDGRLDQEVRMVRLGHLQRGGAPSAGDRVLASTLGAAAVSVLAEGRSGVLVGWDGAAVSEVSLPEVSGRRRTVPDGSPVLTAARSMGVFVSRASR